MHLRLELVHHLLVRRRRAVRALRLRLAQQRSQVGLQRAPGSVPPLRRRSVASSSALSPIAPDAPRSRGSPRRRAPPRATSSAPPSRAGRLPLRDHRGASRAARGSYRSRRSRRPRATRGGRRVARRGRRGRRARGALDRTVRHLAHLRQDPLLQSLQLQRHAGVSARAVAAGTAADERLHFADDGAAAEQPRGAPPSRDVSSPSVPSRSPPTRHLPRRRRDRS